MFVCVLVLYACVCFVCDLLCNVVWLLFCGVVVFLCVRLLLKVFVLLFMIYCVMLYDFFSL